MKSLVKSFKRLALMSLLPICAPAFAQFPNKPIRIILPYQAGVGAVEVVVRMVADDMATALKQPVVIDYKPGASTVIGATNVATSPADGHTLFVNAQSFLITAQLMPKLPYNPSKDFVPVTMLTSYPHALIVGPDAPYRNAKEFIAAAQQYGEKMSYGSFGNASSGHLAFEGLKKTYGFSMVHVPYKGTEGMNDVMAGRLDAMLNDLPVVAPFAKSGKLRILAVASDKRDPIAPDVPTFAEVTGTTFKSRSWFGVLARSGTPPEVLKVLNASMVNALRRPEIVEKMKTLGVEGHPSTPEQFQSFMDSEASRIAEAIKFSGATMQ